MAKNTGTPSVHVLLLLLCLPVHVDSVFNASMIYSFCIIFSTYVLSVNLGVYYSIGSGTLLLSQQWFIFLLLWPTSTYLYINVCQMLASNKVCRNQVKQSNSKHNFSIISPAINSNGKYLFLFIDLPGSREFSNFCTDKCIIQIFLF